MTLATRRDHTTSMFPAASRALAVCLVTVLFSILGLANPTFAAASNGATALESLAQRLGVTAPTNAGTDCATDGTHRVDRHVMQWIDGAVWHWTESDTRAGICSVLLSPEARVLSARETGTLLAASEHASIGDSSPRASVREAPFERAAPRRLAIEPHDAQRLVQALRRGGPTVRHQPGASGKATRTRTAPVATRVTDLDSDRQSLLFGSDDRQRVTNTSEFPWSTVTYVESSYETGDSFGYSGVLISPYAVLTSAFAIYDESLGGFAESVLVVPGQTQTEEGATLIEPFGAVDASIIEVPEAWINTEDPAELYGVAFVDEPFDGINSFMPLVFDALPAGDFNLAGYDFSGDGESLSFAQWTRSGPLQDSDEIFFFHQLDDDEGALGAPAWDFSGPGGARRIFGLECCATTDETANAGIRLTASNRDLIEDWLSFIPDNGGGVVPPLGTDPLFVGGDSASRFKIETAYVDRRGNSGGGNPIRLTDDTGYFWFFSDDNVELVIKVLNGCRLNDRFWIFAAGLTDVEVTLRVEDTETNQVWDFKNPQGNAFPPVQDTSAFATCDG